MATIDGSCHCGAVRWRFAGVPDTATACNCTICRRYGVLWAYGHDGEGVDVSGETRAYVRGDRSIGFHFCPACGCVAYWRALETGPDGRRRIAVNLRLAEPDAVAAVRLRHLDALDSWQSVPRDTRCVADLWF
ncbi:MAG: GFA family protein [Azospirillaceae bacterium]